MQNTNILEFILNNEITFNAAKDVRDKLIKIMSNCYCDDDYECIRAYFESLCCIQDFQDIIRDYYIKHNRYRFIYVINENIIDKLFQAIEYYKFENKKYLINYLIEIQQILPFKC